jgi:hypothetical protein
LLNDYYRAIIIINAQRCARICHIYCCCQNTSRHYITSRTRRNKFIFVCKMRFHYRKNNVFRYSIKTSYCKTILLIIIIRRRRRRRRKRRRISICSGHFNNNCTKRKKKKEKKYYNNNNGMKNYVFRYTYT